MEVRVYKSRVAKSDLAAFAKIGYGDMLKGVVDLQKRIMALGGEWHADCEQVLLDQGSRQIDLWGFNIYPGRSKEQRLEYTSLINIRPKQNNFQIEIKSEQLRDQMKTIIDSLIG